MRAHYLQHVEFEGLGSIEQWLDAAGYTIGGTRLFRGEAFADPGALDMLIVMGGAMSVNDERALPWLAAEKTFVRACIDRGVPVLGVCLGAQIIVSALGGKVYRNPQKEIGWFSVERVDALSDMFQFPARTDVFHWHGETFELPYRSPGSTVHLARSVACEHQAFQFGRHTIGLQFHLEVTSESIRQMIENCSDELVPAPYVQTAEQMLDVPRSQYVACNALMGEVLTYLSA
jgi:GMP synthase-like glutamine amidotransferase